MNQAEIMPRTRLIVHAVVSILALGFAVWIAHVSAHLLVQRVFHDTNVANLQSLVFLSQAALIGVFTLIIGSFVHRYPEPFFIFWYFGWIAWLFLYSARSFHLVYLDLPFNVLNTCFFFTAGLDLILPKSLDHLFKVYPMPPGKSFGSPAVWLVKYYQNNPYSALLLSPVVILSLVQQYSHVFVGYSAGLFATVSIAILGYGLYRRLVLISPRAAFGALLVHAIYLEPQIATVAWPVGVGHEFDYLLTVSAPSLVLKPALALFVTLVALRETSETRDEAKRNLVEATNRVVEAERRASATLVEAERRASATLQAMVRNLPAACLLIMAEKIVLLNDAAEELLHLGRQGKLDLPSVFATQAEYHRFLAQLQKDGRTIGHLAKIRTNGSMEGSEVTKWVRIDAFEANASVSEKPSREIVMLILDRHELELAHASFSFAHDYLFPRVQRLSGSIAQLHKDQSAEEGLQSKECLEQQCAELLEGIAVLREEFREYWRVHPRAAEGALVERSLDVAWAQALRACSVALNCEPKMTRHGDPLPDGTQSLVVSERQLTQLIQNLLINAIQHTYKRENRPDLSPVEVELSYRDGWVSVLIRDHGSGFSDDVRRFLSEPDSVGAEGIGLGLFRLKLTVAAAGGKVTAGNKSGGWVEIRLPASVPQAQASSA